jgi:hypothetical protein
LNSDLYDALVEHLAWYQKRFGAVHDEWYLFPFGKPKPSDPTRHVTSLKTAWKNVRKNAKVKGRWHDNRHTLITELAESGAATKRSWRSPVTSIGRCFATTATFA